VPIAESAVGTSMIDGIVYGTVNAKDCMADTCL